MAQLNDPNQKILVTEGNLKTARAKEGEKKKTKKNGRVGERP